MLRFGCALALSFFAGVLTSSAYADKIVDERTLMGVYYGGSEEKICATLLERAQSKYKVLNIVRDCTCSDDVTPQCYWMLRVED